jgi:hypothetical protein
MIKAVVLDEFDIVSIVTEVMREKKEVVVIGKMSLIKGVKVYKAFVIEA